MQITSKSRLHCRHQFASHAGLLIYAVSALCLGQFEPGVVTAQTFSATNSSTIVINDNSPATPYPSSISVAGLSESVSHVTVTVWGLEHTFASDISMLLVGPQGQTVVLMNVVGDTNNTEVSVDWLTFDDSAPAPLPYDCGDCPITNGNYQPTDGATFDFYFPPAPAGPYQFALSAFNGTVANGTWSLYVEDTSPGDVGMITNGWTLNIATVPVYDGVNLGDPTQTQADWDGDGVTNLVEYAVGTDPNNPADGNAGMIMAITNSNGSRYVSLQYKQRVNAAALQLQYLPEISGDRTNWSSATIVDVTPLDSDFNRVTVADQTAISATAPRFIRLRVLLNSSQASSPVWVGSDTTILGTGGGDSVLTAFSQRMVRPVQNAGKITQLQNAAFTDINAVWADGEFGTNGLPAYVEFDSGWMVDIADTSASTKTLLLADTITGLASVGDSYRIRPHFTVASLFGTNNEAGLTAGSTAARSDNILLLKPETQQTTTIFYFSNSANQGWALADRRAFVPNRVIYPEQGVLVRRIASADGSLYLSGPVKTGIAVVSVQPGYNLLGTLKSSRSILLQDLNLYTADPTTGLVAGNAASAADNLLVIQANGSTVAYSYAIIPGVFQGWADSNLNPVTNIAIPAGATFVIKRQNPGAFAWTIPVE